MTAGSDGRQGGRRQKRGREEEVRSAWLAHRVVAVSVVGVGVGAVGVVAYPSNHVVSWVRHGREVTQPDGEESAYCKVEGVEKIPALCSLQICRAYNASTQ